MDITTIYQVTVQPIAAGAESFTGTFVQMPTIQDVRDAIGQGVPLLNDVYILEGILGHVTGLPQISAHGHEDTAAITVKSAGVTIGTIRVTALLAFSREMQEAIA